MTVTVDRPTPAVPATLGRLAGTPLSAREAQVLELVSRGKTNGQICRALGLTEAAVKACLKRIWSKLEVTDRTSAAAEGFRRGELKVPEAKQDDPAPAERDPQTAPLLTAADPLSVPVGAVLINRLGDAVQRMRTGAFWVVGERWPLTAREITDQGPFRLLPVPRGGAS